MNIKDCLNRAATESPDRVALQYKRDGQWKTTSFGQLRERAWHVSEMLAKLGVGEGDRVSICLDNSAEWYEIYHGIVALGAIAVPVDPKLREQEVGHVFHDCGVSVVLCAPRSAEMLEGMTGQLRDLRTVVVLDCEAQDLLTCTAFNYHAYKSLWVDVSPTALSPNRAFDQGSVEVNSPASFIYTSGTTGRPKGAVLTHRNFVSNVESVVKEMDARSSDNFMLVLPLHHSFAFTIMLVLPAYVQCQVSLVENMKTIKPNMFDCSPTVLIAVPLLYEKILAGIMKGIKAKKVALLMYRYGLAKVVGRKAQQALGGSLRIMISGGAPIGPSTLNNWNKLGFKLIEGYGITETAPVLTLNPPDAPRVGTVGLPIAGVEIDIAEPNESGVGEIIARGDNVMQGYYNNPEETAKVLIDGWYHTGDMGYIDDKGYVVISGRKKSLIVNREGKNIYPEEVERQVLKSEYVLECLALGYREQGEETGERVGLIAVPDQEVFTALEDRTGQRLSDEQIETMVRDDIRTYMSELSSYKQPRKIEIRFAGFEKTSTQKIRRYLYAIDTSQ